MIICAWRSQINRRCPSWIFSLALAMSVLSLSPVAAQAPATAPKTAAKAKPATAKRVVLKTPWGEPDLQGVWNDATSTPLQRPNSVGEKDILTDEEAGEFQKELENELSRDSRDGVGTAADVGRAYNEHWMDSRHLKITPDHRTSLIIDPPDGRIPPFVPFTAERAKARQARATALARFGEGLPNTYIDATLPVRCIIRTDSP